MPHFLEQHVREEVAPEGMTYLTVDLETGLRCLRDLIKDETRARLLEWIHANDTVLQLNMGDAPFPKGFRELLSSVPNRGSQHAIEDTAGQCTELMRGSDFQLGICSLFAEGGHAVCDAVKMVNGGIGTIYRIQKKIDTGMLGTTMLQMAQKANQLGIWDEFVEDMRAISHKSAHMKQLWTHKNKGTVLLVPESSVMHRRNGQRTAQVAWHTDTQDGTIVFSKEHDQVQPSRVLW